ESLIDKGNTSYGKYIVLKHSGGYSTLYAHLMRWEVRVGEKVTYGQVIGRVGSTGGSTGPHLHYEQKLNGSTVRSVFDNDKPADYFTTRNYRVDCRGGGDDGGGDNGGGDNGGGTVHRFP